MCPLLYVRRERYEYWTEHGPTFESKSKTKRVRVVSLSIHHDTTCRLFSPRMISMIRYLSVVLAVIDHSPNLNFSRTHPHPRVPTLRYFARL